jgi:hypothetical protein
MQINREKGAVERDIAYSKHISVLVLFTPETSRSLYAYEAQGNLLKEELIIMLYKVIK